MPYRVPYSPDLTIVDHYLFPKFKFSLKDRNFWSAAEILERVTRKGETFMKVQVICKIRRR